MTISDIIKKGIIVRNLGTITQIAVEHARTPPGHFNLDGGDFNLS